MKKRGRLSYYFDAFIGAKTCQMDPYAHGSVYHPYDCPHRVEARRQGLDKTIGKRAIVYKGTPAPPAEPVTSTITMSTGTGKSNSITITFGRTET